MDDTQKMLKALIKGQLELSTKIDNVDSKLSTKIDSVDSKLSTKIDSVDSKLSTKIDSVDSKLSTKIGGVYSELSTKIGELSVNIDDVHRGIQDLRTETRDGFKKVNDRINALGKSLAYLEEDAPTREEFDNLETKVTKIEQILTTA